VASASLAAAAAILTLGPGSTLPALAIGAIASLGWLLALWLQSAPHSAEAIGARSAPEGDTPMDTSTGLMGRTGFAEAAAATFGKASAEGLPLSAVLIDVDHLKMLNEEHGSECGDLILAHVSRLIGLNIQPAVDLATRNAGAEFILLLPEADHAWASTFAERLRGTLSNRPIQYNSDLITISASLGVAERLPGDRDVEAMIRRARGAMRDAKAGGRNLVGVASHLSLAA